MSSLPLLQAGVTTRANWVVGQFVIFWETGPNRGRFGLDNKVGGGVKRDPIGQCHS